jgi:hypothetical protein
MMRSVDREAGMAPEGTTSAGGRLTSPAASRRWRYAFVAILIGVAVSGAVVWARSASDPPDSGAQGIWGTRWQLVRLDVGDAVIDTGLVGSSGGAVVLDARRSGEMSMQVCNETGGPASVVAGRIELGQWFTTAMGCGDPLETLVRLDGAAIEATSKRLVLRSPGESGGPAVRSTWVPSGSLAPDDAIRGRTWSVTEVVGPGGDRQTMGHRIGPVMSLLEPDRVVVTGCGTHSKPGRVVEGRIEVEPGPWTEHVAECESAKASTYTPMILQILDSSAVARRDGYRLRVRGDDGSSFAASPGVGLSVWDLFDDPHEPSTARWLVAEARDHDVQRPLAGAPVLTATVAGSDAQGPRHTVSVSGCGPIEAEVTERQEPPGAPTLTPTPTQEGDTSGLEVDCTEAEADQAAWMNQLLASGPEVAVAHNRAALRGPGLWVVLVRLD